MKTYDLIIIGFGKAGKTLAAKAASEGQSVAVIEKDAGMYGGTCINVGCIPSKSLVTSSQIAKAHENRSGEKKAEAYKEAIEKKRALTAMLRQKNYDKLDSLDQVTVIDGVASFTGPHTIQVQTDNETLELSSDKIVINTGSEPVILPIPGLQDNSLVYTSAELLDLDVFPKRLLIIGGGYIGLEFASIYSLFGSEVSVLQDGEQLVKREDRDIAQALQNSLEKKGVKFYLGAAIQNVAHNGQTATISFTQNDEEKVLEGDVILLATGRKPNISSLNLDQAGIEITKRGAIKVDDQLQTNVPGVWAVGDVNGGQQFTYVSLDDFRILWAGMHGDRYDRSRRQNVPYSVFLSPTYSRVGLNEQEAKDLGYTVRVVTMPAAAIPKAQVLGKTEGVLKAVIDYKTDQILGAMFFCEDSHEMINVVKLAMDLGAPYQKLRDMIFTHPTMSESMNDLFSM